MLLRLVVNLHYLIGISTQISQKLSLKYSHKIKNSMKSQKLNQLQFISLSKDAAEAGKFHQSKLNVSVNQSTKMLLKKKKSLLSLYLNRNVGI